MTNSGSSPIPRRPDILDWKVARITSTTLGFEDHGCLTLYLHLDYGGSGQGAGGYALDTYDEDQSKRIGTATGTDMILGILRALGVGKWEDLPGRTIMVQATETKVIAIKPLPMDPGHEFAFASVFTGGAPS